MPQLSVLKRLALLEDDLKNKSGPENYKVYISFILITGVSSSIENCCFGEYCSKNVAGNITALRIIKCSGNNFISPACQNGNSFLLSFYYIFMWVISRVAKRQIQSRIWIKAPSKSKLDIVKNTDLQSRICCGWENIQCSHASLLLWRSSYFGSSLPSKMFEGRITYTFKFYAHTFLCTK